jgi:FkbM family methyltransferase
MPRLSFYYKIIILAVLNVSIYVLIFKNCLYHQKSSEYSKEHYEKLQKNLIDSKLVSLPVEEHPRVSKDAKFVFIDLGANKGDSIRNFFGQNEKALGGQLSNLIKLKEVLNKKWIIYAIEANPFFDQVLYEMKTNLESNYGHTVFLFNQTAAWKSDGLIDFYVDEVNIDQSFWGSSLFNNHPDVIKSGKKKVKIRSVDVARIIKQYQKQDLIVLKMDIEGAEYHLLLDFLKKDILPFIDYMTVEYHPGLSVLSQAEDVFEALIKLFGIKSILWN